MIPKMRDPEHTPKGTDFLYSLEGNNVVLTAVDTLGSKTQFKMSADAALRMSVQLEAWAQHAATKR